MYVPGRSSVTAPRADSSAVGVEPALTTAGSIPSARSDRRRRRQSGDLVVGRGGSGLRPGVAVAAVGEDAEDLEPEVAWHWRASAPAASGSDAGSPPAAVDLDEDSRTPRGSPDGRRDRLGPERRIHADRQGAALAEVTKPLGLRPDRDQRVGDEQVVEPAAGEDLGLAERRDGQPGRAGGQLAPAELQALVRLGVRSQRHAPVAHDRRHPGDVDVDAVQVDDDRRGLDRRAGAGVEPGSSSMAPPHADRVGGVRRRVRGKIPPGGVGGAAGGGRGTRGAAGRSRRHDEHLRPERAWRSNPSRSWTRSCGRRCSASDAASTTRSS